MYNILCSDFTALLSSGVDLTTVLKSDHLSYGLYYRLFVVTSRVVIISYNFYLCAVKRLTFMPYWYYLLSQEKYRKLHPRLLVIVAETLLYTDPQIELPLWLVHMFKVTLLIVILNLLLVYGQLGVHGNCF